MITALPRFNHTPYAMRETTARYPEGTPIPRPPHWGGFRLEPETVEFWEGREDRLHDRLRYRRTADGWALERLAPEPSSSSARPRGERR